MHSLGLVTDEASYRRVRGAITTAQELIVEKRRAALKKPDIQYKDVPDEIKNIITNIKKSISASLSISEMQKEAKNQYKSALKQLARAVSENDADIIKEKVKEKFSLCVGRNFFERDAKLLGDHHIVDLAKNSFKGKLLRMGSAVAQFFGFKEEGRFTRIAALIRTTSVFYQVMKDVKRNPTWGNVDAEEEMPSIFKDKVEKNEELLKKQSVVVIKKNNEVLQVAANYVKGTKAALKQLRAFIRQKMTTRARGVQKNNFIIRDEAGQPKIKLHVALTPGNKKFDEKVGLDVEARKNYFELTYGDQGVSSMDYESDHAINLWYEEGKVTKEGDANGRGYGFMRTGVLSGRGEKDKSKRKDRALSKAKDIAMMAILQRGKKMTIDALIEDLKKNPVSLIAASLLTPCLPGDESDKRMLKEQIEAYRMLENEGLKLDIDGQEIDVKFNAYCFNYGANKGAMMGAGQSQQKKINDPSLNKLAEYIKTLPEGEVDIQKRDRILCLLDDIKELNTDYAFHRSNPYIVSAKLIMLANELREWGFEGVINCLSGKDRTGVAAAVIHTLQIMSQEMDGYFTNVDLRQDETQCRFLEIYMQTLAESKGLEVTEINTDAKGFKTALQLFPNCSFWKGKEGKERLMRLKELLGLSKTTEK